MKIQPNTWFLPFILLVITFASHTLWATDLVNVNITGTGGGNSGARNPQITPDGRFVAFESSASNLVTTTDNNREQNIFVRDLQTNTTALASINVIGEFFTDFDSRNPQITPDGRFVVFNRESGNVYMRDLQLGTTTLVSIDTTGTRGGNFSSNNQQITPDGRFVLFQSSASDLVTIDNNEQPDIFVRDLWTKTTTLVSINAVGTDSGNGSSYQGLDESPQITPDGRFVVFQSRANNLVTTDNNGEQDIFVRDLQVGTTTLISINTAGTDSGNRRSGYFDPKITPDGRFVVFDSFANDLVANDNNSSSVSDVFIRDLQTTTTTLVSVNITGTGSGNNFSGNPQITPDGRFVVFSSRASDLVSADNNEEFDIFVRDLQMGTTTLVSINAADTNGGNDTSRNPQISSDGRFVTFESDASDLVTTDIENRESDIFLRDLQTETTTLVSSNTAGTGGGNDFSFDPKITPDGQFIVFESRANNLATIDTSSGVNVYRFFNENANLDGNLAASILPTSRSVQVGTQAAAFATLINISDNTAIQCSINPSANIPANFTYQATDPTTNMPTGNPNVPVDIAPLPELQTFLITFTPTAAFNPTEVEFNFSCNNSNPAPVIQGVNTLLLSASDTPVPDIIALAATAGETPGIVNIPGATGTGAFAVATVNLGTTGEITVSANTGDANLPLNISLCETNPATGNCLAAPSPSVTTEITANATPTFSIFATGTGSIPFDPAANRIFTRFTDDTGAVRGSTSVAVHTQ